MGRGGTKMAATEGANQERADPAIRGAGIQSEIADRRQKTTAPSAKLKVDQRM